MTDGDNCPDLGKEKLELLNGKSSSGFRRDTSEGNTRADTGTTRSVGQGDRGEGHLAGEGSIIENICVLCLFMHCALERLVCTYT